MEQQKRTIPSQAIADQLRPKLDCGYTGPTDNVVHLPRSAKPFGEAEIAETLGDLFAADEKVVRFPGRTPSN